MRQILTEFIAPSSRPLIMEGTGGQLCLKGLFIQGAMKNHNGRMYPPEQIQAAVQQIMERIQSIGPVIGELDHPEGLNINMDRASHVITEMHMEGNDGYGTMRIMNAGMGLIVRGLIDVGAQLGVSSRGSGSLGQDGRVDDFDIKTVDIVADPSAPGALPRAIRESVEKSVYGREVLSLTGHIRNDRSAQKHIAKAMTAFLMEARDELVFGR